VVELPRLVADQQVVVLVPDHVVEDVEVGEQDLVHAPEGLEAVQVVLGGLALEVLTFVGEQPRRRVHVLPRIVEDPGDGVLGQPVDLQVGVTLAQPSCDGDVALSVPEPDR